MSLLLWSSCGTLSAIDEGVCGNAAVEPEAGEDCDTYVATDLIDSGGHCIGPGKPHQCRYSCAVIEGTAEHYVCPPGWGCASDDICRHGTSAFALPELITVAPGRWLQAADFNGDRTDDLFTQGAGHLIVDYLADGRLAERYRVPLFVPDLQRPQAADISGDGLADLTVSSNQGLLIFTGDPDNQLRSKIFLTWQLPPDLVASSLVVADVAADKGDEGVVHTRNKSTLLGLSADGMLLPDDGHTYTHSEGSHLVAPMVAGQLDENSPADEVVAIYDDGWVGAYQLVVQYDAVDDMHKVTITASQQVTMAVGAAKGVQLGHFNDDEHLDLLLTVEQSGGAALSLVAFGTGSGTFASDADLTTVDNMAGPLPGHVGCPAALALGDINGDGNLDLVGSAGIFLSQPGPLPLCAEVTIPVPLEGQWREAAFGDFNGDGLLDLAAAGDSSLLDFFIGTGSQQLTYRPIAAAGPIRRLAVGDFDGDQIADVAFSEDRAAGPRDGLSIAFGSPAQGLSEPQLAGTLFAIDSLLTAHVRRTDIDYVDAPTDLVVLTGQDPSTGMAGAAVVHGRADRVLQSPFAIDHLINNKVLRNLPVAVTTARGTFAAAGGTTENAVIAVGRPEEDQVADPDARLSVVAALTDADLAVSDEPTRLNDTSDYEDAVIVAFDPSVEGDPVEVAIISQPLTQQQVDQDPEPARQVDLIVGPATGTQLLSAKAELPDKGLAGVPQASSIKYLDELPTTALSCTLRIVPQPDGGQRPERSLLLLLGRLEGSDVTPVIYTLTAADLRDIQAGSFSDDSSRELSGTQLASSADSPEIILGFTCLNTDDDEPEEVAVVTLADSEEAGKFVVRVRIIEPDGEGRLSAQSAVLVSHDKEPLRVDPPEDKASPLSPVLDFLPPVKGMVAGDVNGDGVGDLVLAFTGSFAVMRGIAQRP